VGAGAVCGLLPNHLVDRSGRQPPFAGPVLAKTMRSADFGSGRWGCAAATGLNKLLYPDRFPICRNFAPHLRLSIMSPPTKRSRRSRSASFSQRLGTHPPSTHPYGAYFAHTDGVTATSIPHRAMAEERSSRRNVVLHIRTTLKEHHASPEQLERTRKLLDVYARQNVPVPKSLRRFPQDDNTRKGNFAEIVLADYITNTTPLSVPVYRLRYNPNVEQSMKGDDVLAFDVDSNPVRVIVGEAKFRETPTKKVVQEIAAALDRSFQGGVPASLQFVADQLYESGEEELGARIADCAVKYAEGKALIEYVGLLFSGESAGDYVHDHTPEGVHRLVMLSAAVPAPSKLVDDCYRGL
jgi:hypothetical protein